MKIFFKKMLVILLLSLFLISCGDKTPDNNDSNIDMIDQVGFSMGGDTEIFVNTTLTRRASNSKIDNVKYTSSDPSVASISDEGLITAYKAGTTTIKGTSLSKGRYNYASATFILTSTVRVPIDQVGFSITGGDKTVERDSPPLFFTLENSGVDDVIFTSSDPSVATIDMYSGKATIHKIGITTIEAASYGDGKYNPASASSVLTVTETILQNFFGGAYLNTNQTETSVGFNSDSGKMESGITSACNSGVNSGINQHKMLIFSSGSKYIIRCGEGAIYTKMGEIEFKGQASFKISHDGQMIVSDGFSRLEYPTSGGLGHSFPVWSNIPLGTTKVLTELADGTDFQVTKSLYNSDGVYTFIDGNFFGISAGIQVSSCHQVISVQINNPVKVFKTVVCPGYGAVPIDDGFPE